MLPPAWARRARCPVITFGPDPSADLWCLRRRRVEEGISFYLYGKMEMRLPVFGLHNCMNTLAAIGVVLRLGVPPMTIRDRLTTFSAPDMRLNRQMVNGVTLINDAEVLTPAFLATLDGDPPDIFAPGWDGILRSR